MPISKVARKLGGNVYWVVVPVRQQHPVALNMQLQVGTHTDMTSDVSQMCSLKRKFTTRRITNKYQRFVKLLNCYFTVGRFVLYYCDNVDNVGRPLIAAVHHSVGGRLWLGSLPQL